MAQHLIPSAATLKAIRPGDTRRRLSDGEGLYLLLFVKGGSHGWRLDYTIQGRRKTLSLGTYPATGLGVARQKAEEARQLVNAGTDPSEARQQRRQSIAKQRQIEKLVDAGLPVPESFEAVAREWYGKQQPSWAPSHADKIIRRLERDVFPWLGSKPIQAIKPPELLQVLKRVEARGAIETTHRVQQNCGQVFRYAVAVGLLDSDPSRDLRGALPPWRPEHYPTLTDPRRVGQLLVDIFRLCPAEHSLNMPASIWYALAPSWLLMRMISCASGLVLTWPACRMRIMCLVNSALPSTRLCPCATMKGSKPSLRKPRRTSMVGM